MSGSVSRDIECRAELELTEYVVRAREEPDQRCFARLAGQQRE
jgi:hypothetical protein